MQVFLRDYIYPYICIQIQWTETFLTFFLFKDLSRHNGQRTAHVTWQGLTHANTHEIIAIIKIMDIFITSKSFLVPLCSLSLYHLSSGNQGSAFCHYRLNFLKFYINEVCALFMPGFFHSAQLLWDKNAAVLVHCFWLLSSSSLYTYTTFCLCIHWLMGILVIFSLGLLTKKLPWTFMCKPLWRHMLSFPLNRLLRVKWLGYVVGVCLRI